MGDVIERFPATEAKGMWERGEQVVAVKIGPLRDLEQRERDLIAAGDALYEVLSVWTLGEAQKEAWCKARFAGAARA